MLYLPILVTYLCLLLFPNLRPESLRQNIQSGSKTVDDFIEAFAAPKNSGKALNQAADRRNRIANIIEEYDSQGFHRTGTAVDRVSALWLVGRIQQLGIEARLEPFSLSRIDPIQAYIQIGNRKIEGVPLFDGTFTDATGIRGSLGLLGSKADIAVTQVSPGPDLLRDKEFQNYRRSGQYKGIIAITKGDRPGLALQNAPDFTSPFGSPVLQVSSEEASWLEKVAKQKRDTVLVTQVRRTDVDALNVTATLKGLESSLAPLVIITPRSGWWHCAAERGGGLACWLEAMAALSAKKPSRDVIFVASTGHELGHLGLKFFLAHSTRLAQTARLWFHFGADIGAAVGSGSILSTSTREFQKMAVVAMNEMGVPPQECLLPGQVPLGEVFWIHQKQGHYISLRGSSHLFRHPEDRWPYAVDVDQINRLACTFAALSVKLAV
jgi:hypothetical protein